VHLRYSEPATDRKDASQREYAIKSLRKAKKMRLITT
jgi:predicted GIY-YIG superfamily endonuclease